MLKGLFRRLVSGTVTLQAELPSELRVHALHKQTEPLVAWLRDKLEKNAAAPELQSLLEMVRAAGWSEKDIDKLAIAGLSGAKHWGEAVNRSIPYISNTDNFDPDLFMLAANALYQLNRFEEAGRLIDGLGDKKVLLAEHPGFALIAALVAFSNGQMVEAKRHIDTARHLAPDDLSIALNAYLINFEYGDDEAVAILDTGLRTGRYGGGAADVARGVVELARGHYDEGLRLLEGRYELDDAWRYFNPALLNLPRWCGESLDGKVLLVAAEQGLGDCIQMMRYLPRLAELNVAKVIMEVPRELFSLAQESYPEVTFVERVLGSALPMGFDLWIGVASLAYRLGAAQATIPYRRGYLSVPAESRLYWQRRLAELAQGQRPRIGIAWSGRPTHRADRRRSIPVDLMVAAMRSTDAWFFPLQTHVPDLKVANLVNIADELVTLADTAALIMEMDLVITIDSAPVHLAGALGKDTWLLLPARYEWRWGLDGEGNDWYDSVKVIRQHTHGAWTELLEDLFNVRLPRYLEN